MVVVHAGDVPPVSGGEVLDSMTPEWAHNLGPRATVEAAYRRFSARTLLFDERTTRRIDLVEIGAGYADPTDSYHDTVEECLFLGGECRLFGEGDFAAGDYFWRPPGWIHGALTKTGFRALLMVEGDNALEASGRASRRIRPREQCGTNALHQDPAVAAGPRGRVVKVTTAWLPWIPGAAFAPTFGSLDGFDRARVEFKILSRNVLTGALSLLVRLRPGFEAARLGSTRHGLDLFVVAGHPAVGESLAPGDLVGLRPGGGSATLCADDEAILFVKAAGPLDF